MTQTVLIDNARALVVGRDAATDRARTKGKIESGVGYVKKNTIFGRTFERFAALEAHLAAWTTGVADDASPDTGQLAKPDNRDQ